jgi:hypothetical protein
MSSETHCFMAVQKGLAAYASAMGPSCAACLCTCLRSTGSTTAGPMHPGGSCLCAGRLQLRQHSLESTELAERSNSYATSSSQAVQLTVVCS